MTDTHNVETRDPLENIWVAMKAVEADDTYFGELRQPFVKAMLVFKASLYGEKERIRKINAVAIAASKKGKA